MVLRSRKNCSYITKGEGLQEELYIQERKRATVNLQPGRDGVRRTNTTASISPHTSFFLMVLELTRSQRTQSRGKPPRIHRAGWNWVEKRHEGTKGKYQPKGPPGRLHREPDICSLVVVIFG